MPKKVRTNLCKERAMEVNMEIARRMSNVVCRSRWLPLLPDDSLLLLLLSQKLVLLPLLHFLSFLLLVVSLLCDLDMRIRQTRVGIRATKLIARLRTSWAGPKTRKWVGE